MKHQTINIPHPRLSTQPIQVHSVAFHPTELILATGIGDNTAKLWQFSKEITIPANFLANLEGHANKSFVLSIAFHPTRPLLATGSTDKTVKLWSLLPDNRTVNCEDTLEGHTYSVTSVAFHPTESFLVTGSYDKTAKLWRLLSNPTSAMCVATLAGHSHIVMSVAFHPTKLILATGSSDTTAKLWSFLPDGSQATCVATLEGHLGQPQINTVSSVAFHPTTNLLATASGDKTVKLWRFLPDDWSTPVVCVATLKGHTEPLFSVAFHPTVPLLATGSWDKTAKLWLLSPDNSSVKCVATLTGHAGWVSSVAFHSTMPFLATGSEDGTVKLWDISRHILSTVTKGQNVYRHMLNREIGPGGSTTRPRWRGGKSIKKHRRYKSRMNNNSRKRKCRSMYRTHRRSHK
jgi:WD40 repeat protein